MAMYNAALKGPFTEKAYEHLTTVPSFAPHLPSTLPKLKRAVEKLLLGKSFDSLNVRIFSYERHNLKIPYVGISSVICHWLSIESLQQSIIHTNNTFTLPFITSRYTLKNAIEERYLRESVGNLCDGTAWLKLLLDTFILWSSRVNEYKDTTQVIFLHLLHHNDEYGWKGTAKNDRKSTVWLISCGEIERSLRNDLSTYATLPLLLCSSKEYKSVGVSRLLSIFDDELQELSKGKLFIINEKQFLVVAFLSNILGDIPARKEIFGLSSSANLQMPCHVCTIKLPEMRNQAILTSRGRDDGALNRFIANPTYSPGKDQSSITPSMNTTGFNFYSHIWKFPGQPRFTSIMIDIMHMYYLGILRDAFEVLSKLLLSNRSEDRSWQRLSKLYLGYCKLNNIQSYYNFTNFNTWKGLKAYGIKKFCAVSPFLLLQMDLVSKKTNNESDPAYKKRQEFKLWNSLCLTASILAQHTISRSDLETVKALIEYSLHHLKEKSERQFTLNFHLQIHMFQHIIEHGVPREYWCFPHETMIGKIKGMYRHTNNKSTHTSLLKRYMGNINISSITAMMASEREDETSILSLEELSTALGVSPDELPPWVTEVKLLEDKEYRCNFANVRRSYVVEIDDPNDIGASIFCVVNSFFELNDQKYLSYEKLEKKHENLDFTPKKITTFGFTSQQERLELVPFEAVLVRWLYLPVNDVSVDNIRQGDRYLVEQV